MMRRYSCSESVLNFIEHYFQSQNTKLTQASAIADCVLRLSDWFIQNPRSQTPWHEPWAQIAYVAYYLPLNEVRAFAIAEQGERFGFFEGLDHFYDFGSGLGSVHFALRRSKSNQWTQAHHLDISSLPHQILTKFSTLSFETSAIKIKPRASSLFTASYSLTEETLPRWAYDCEALMLIEPATSEDSRQLLRLRQDLISKNFSIWAPCTHQQNCPLLTQTKKDWCHDRIEFVQPDWFNRIENHLPFKNKTLTMSYLLARKKPAPLLTKPFLDQQWARLTGDQLVEKGKTRQMLCRSEKREFITWMHKHGPVPESFRGDLLAMKDLSFELKANELRVLPKHK